MRRIVQFVVIFIIIFSTSSLTYSQPKTSGEILKSYGLLTGDYNGDLNEDQFLTRAEMMVILSRMMGRFDEASTFDWGSSFDDRKGHWSEPFVAYAQTRGWTTGIGNNLFGYDNRQTLREATVFMLKVLGYTPDVDFSWKSSFDFAVQMGIVEDNTLKPEEPILRGDLFRIMLKTLNSDRKGSNMPLIQTIPIDESALHIETIRAVDRSAIELIFSEPLKIYGDVIVSAVEGEIGIRSIQASGDDRVIVRMNREMTEGVMLTVKASDFVGNDEDVSVLYHNSLFFVPDLIPAKANVLSASHLTLAIEFSKPVRGLSTGHIIYNNGSHSPLGLYKDKEMKNPVDSEDEVSKIYVLLAEKQDSTFIGNPLPAGEPEIRIRPLNSTGRSLLDTWGVPFGGGTYKVSIAGDATPPSVVRFELSSDKILRIEFSENVVFSATNIDVRYTTGALVPNLWLSTSGMGKVYYIRLNDANLAGKSIRVNVRNVQDQAFIPNTMSLFTATADIPDVVLPFVKVVVKDTNSKTLYVAFSKSVDSESATSRTRYAITLNNSTLVLSNTPVEIKNSLYKLSLTNTEYTLAQSAGAQLTVSGVKDLSGNTMATQSFNFSGMNDVSLNPPQLVNVYATDNRSITAVFDQMLTRVDIGAFKVNFSSASNLTYAVSNGQTFVKLQTAAALPGSLAGVSLFVDTTGLSKVQNLYGIDVKNVSRSVEDRR